MGVGHIQTADEVKSHLDVYDTGIHYVDYFVGKLIQDLKIDKAFFKFSLAFLVGFN